jgi:hypothetical protein
LNFYEQRDNVEWDEQQIQEAKLKIEENSKKFMEADKSGNLQKKAVFSIRMCFFLVYCRITKPNGLPKVYLAEWSAR